MTYDLKMIIVPLDLNNLVMGLVFCSLVFGESPDAWWKIGQNELTETLQVQNNYNWAKNVIVFVGDGMSVTTVTASRILRGQLNGANGEEGYLYFEKFPHSGLIKAYSNNMQVSESSASGTALFSGQKVNSETVGMSAQAIPKICAGSQQHSINGLLQWAQTAGKSTGAVTTTRVTHSTPAALYAHSADEDWEADSDFPQDQLSGKCKDIARQLIENDQGQKLNVILGGGWTKFLPNSSLPAKYGPGKGSRADGRNLIDEWISQKNLQGANCSAITTRGELLDVDPVHTDFLLGLFSESTMAPIMGRSAIQSTEPQLKEMAIKAVEVLKKNPNGYFLMVEGGLIDDAHHKGHAARALHETIGLADAVEAVDAITNSSETLIIVVADHSHSLVFTGYQKRGNPILGHGFRKMLDGKPYTSLFYASGRGGIANEPRKNISGDDTSQGDYAYPAFLPTNWGMHLGEDVPVYAKGPYSHLFVGVHEQHYVAHAINYAACLRNDTLTTCQKKHH